MNDITMNISDKLIYWYRKNKRDLPWRKTRDPYLIWISEIILQQTRVQQGLSYYQKFTERYKNIFEFANADLDEILKLWQGLGYYSRARNMHEAAHQIINNYDGKFPQSYDQLIKIKGIGPYTAAAIASIAFNQPTHVVDGNVIRVITRLFGIHDDPTTSIGRKTIDSHAAVIMNKKNPNEHNQAIMEFGALHCTPTNPDCLNCPLSDICIAHEKELTDIIPLKKKKIKQKIRYFYYIYIQFDNWIFIRKRTEKDIWKSLYEFPLIESARELMDNEIITHPDWIALFNDIPVQLTSISKSYYHILSHQKIYAKFIHLHIPTDLNANRYNTIKIKKQSIIEYAVPRLIENYLENKF